MSSPIPRQRNFVANWKMNMLSAEAEGFLDQFAKLYTPGLGASDAWIAPPLTVLPTVREKVRALRGVRVGVQNVHWLASGAHTGEVSVPMVKEAGAEFAILGHSERRQFYGETDKAVSERAKATLQGGLFAIVCVGETKTQFEAKETHKVVQSQLRGSLEGIDTKNLSHLLVAYEPVWAIGTGLTATPEIAANVHALIRNELNNFFGAQASAQVPILYGGSTTPENVAGLVSQPNVDGALIGGASLKPETFAKLISEGRAA